MTPSESTYVLTWLARNLTKARQILVTSQWFVVFALLRER